MKRDNWFFSFLFAGLIVGMFYFMGRSSKDLEERVASVAQRQEIKQDSEKAVVILAPVESIPKTTTVSNSEINTFREAYPSFKKVKAQVAKNPHTTPRALTSFAKALSPLVEKGLSNSQDAALVVKELDDCIMNKSVAHSAQALSLLNAEKLGRVHPQVKAIVDDTRSRAPAEVIKILHKKDLLMKR